MIESTTMAQGKDLAEKPEGVSLPPQSNVLGCITGSCIDEYSIYKPTTVIGKNSANSLVDLHLNLSSYISRKHIIINHDKFKLNPFTMDCFGKNGIFVDGSFHMSGTQNIPLDEKFVYQYYFT